ncbi:HNH endonuclease [Variovorax robiniae]|uniref:HNH endonuclease n=1 Tax=Variovorax robiniae TaxID=1836199 RepID=A0ABU8XFL7_9BURK
MEEKTQKTGGRYRYGDRRTWEIVSDAALSFDRPVTVREIEELVLAEIPHFAPKNFLPDLSATSVNSRSRGNFLKGAPRRTDAGSEYDRLFRIGEGRGVRYLAYDPEKHGVWELYDGGGKVLSVRQIKTADDLALERARHAFETNGQFSPADMSDERKRVLAAMVLREGQPAFRAGLIRAYGGRCAITGCPVVDLLDAAHIARFSGPKSNVMPNGLLLRTDIHKLFDLHLICVNPGTLKLQVSDTLLESEYARLAGQSIRLPCDAMDAPSLLALREHRQDCAWALADDAEAGSNTKVPGDR